MTDTLSPPPPPISGSPYRAMVLKSVTTYRHPYKEWTFATWYRTPDDPTWQLLTITHRPSRFRRRRFGRSMKGK